MKDKKVMKYKKKNLKKDCEKTIVLAIDDRMMFLYCHLHLHSLSLSFPINHLILILFKI